MATINPQRIVGKWRVGYALDLHSLSSAYIGVDQFGHDRYDTKRSEMGELLYQLKYKQNASVIPAIVEAAASFIGTSFRFEMIVPVPPTEIRPVQPVLLVANALGEKFRVPVVSCVTAIRPTTQLKDVNDPAQRKVLLDGLYAVDSTTTQGKRILLFDDLFRSGATMNAITDVLNQYGGAADVSALTLTRARSNS
jgi:competence protein ComFC